MLAGLVVKLAPETEQVNKTLKCWKHQRQCCFFYRFVSKIMSQWKKRNKAEALCGKRRDSDALHWNSISIWCVLLRVFLVVSGSTISPQQILPFSLLLTLSENTEFKKSVYRHYSVISVTSIWTRYLLFHLISNVWIKSKSSQLCLHHQWDKPIKQTKRGFSFRLDETENIESQLMKQHNVASVHYLCSETVCVCVRPWGSESFPAHFQV